MSEAKAKMSAEWRKFKSLKGVQKKWEYIWAYYNYHIIALVILLIFTGSMLNHFIFNPPADTYVNLTFYGGYLPDEISEELTTDLTAELAEDPEKYVVSLDSYYESDDAEMMTAMIQRFAAFLAAQQLDVIVASPENFEGLAAQEILMDLREVYSEEELAVLGDAVLYAPIMEFDTVTGEILSQSEDMPFGIALSGNAYFNDMGLSIDDWVLCFTVNTAKLDESRELAAYVLEWEG